MISRLLTLFSMLLAFTATVEAQTKRAFVVGVGEYEELTDLQKTLGDAEGYRELFQGKLGYQTTYLTDPDEAEFLDAFDRFKASIAPGDEVVFIFSGHGWSDGAENYLALSDAPRDGSENVIRRSTVPLARLILRDLEARKPQLVFAIIDACRDNPFDTLARDFGRGLVPVQQRKGTLVLFAAGARQKALDRLSAGDPSPYSVFTRVLLPKLRETDRPLVDIVDETRDEVERLARTIDHPQRPAAYSDVSRSFCFAGACRSVAGVNVELAAFGQIRDCAGARDFLQRYPNSAYRRQAEGLQTAFCAAPVSAPVTDTTRPPAQGPTVTASSRQPVDVFRDCDDCPEMVVIPSGAFLMGSPEGEEKRGSDEGPQRTVRIGYEFAVGKFEVTWAAWEACVADGGCDNASVITAGGDYYGWGKGSRPVINVSWTDAQAYVQWLSRKTGERYRLLSEAEWEYVARAGTSTRFSWGDGDPTCSRGASNGANFRRCSSNRTEPVGFSAANAFGVHDMHGNVSEWTEDCYVDSYSGAPTDGSARTVSNCSDRVLRGGSRSDSPLNLRSAIRRYWGPTSRSSDWGFRVARSLED